VDPVKASPSDPTEFLTKLGLVSRFHTLGNVYLFNHEGKMMHYTSVAQILEDYYSARVQAYEARKTEILQYHNEIAERLFEQHRFLTLVVTGDFPLLGRSRADVGKALEHHKFKRIEGSYKYILDLPAHAFTHDYMDALESRRMNHRRQCLTIQNTAVRDIWTAELQHLRIVGNM
jgi:virulence-associated protein VapD